MRLLMLAIAMGATLMLGAARAEAGYGWYPWCAWFPDNVAGGGCFYTSLQACWASVRGVGGYCGVNPYPPPAPPPRYRTRRHYR